MAQGGGKVIGWDKVLAILEGAPLGRSTLMCVCVLFAWPKYKVPPAPT